MKIEKTIEILLIAGAMGYGLSQKLKLKAQCQYEHITSRMIITEIEANGQESRKNWMIWMFKRAGAKNTVIIRYISFGSRIIIP